MRLGLRNNKEILKLKSNVIYDTCVCNKVGAPEFTSGF
jgi:hypothetical protein